MTKFEFSNKEIAQSGNTILDDRKTFIGNPCRKCGESRRRISTFTCVTCSLRTADRHNKNRTADKRHVGRLRIAKRGGYAPPPHERDCSSYPEDNRCQLCGDFNQVVHRLCLEHNHLTGNFRGWVCRVCNSTISNVERIGLDKFTWFVKGSILRSAGFDLPK